MMERIFNMDNGFWRAMSVIADMFWLNLLWFICSIPIFTIGASTTALYYVMLKIVEGKEGNMSRQFFRSFKQNFKQGTIIGVLEIGALLIVILDVTFYWQVDSQIGMLLRIAMIVLGVYITMSLAYVFGVLAKFDNKTKAIVGFSFILPIRHIGATIVMLVLAAVVVCVTIFIFPPLVLLGMGLIAWINCKFLVGIFDKYIPEEKKIDPVDMPLPDLPEDFANPVHIIIDENHPERVVLTEADMAAQDAASPEAGAESKDAEDSSEDK